MNMREVMINTIYRYARETSAGEEVDEYWECVLPEAFACITNEIFLTLHRVHINELMKQRAALFAQTAPPRDISNLENATLMLHYFTRMWLVGKHENRVFQTLVDQSYGVISNTRDAARWVKPSLIWGPTLWCDYCANPRLIGRILQALFLWSTLPCRNSAPRTAG